VSLSQDPAFSVLKDNFICGYKDIEHARYCGASGKHMPDGNAVDTTNGAGPHNIQMFVLTPDGIVLHCLPGYWHSGDLVTELQFAQDLYDNIYMNPNLTDDQKRTAFSRAHLGHIRQHSKAMSNRSRLQGFDAKYEVEKKYNSSDFIANRTMINPNGMKIPPGAMKTVDEVMHERMAARPFVAYEHFDVAAYSDYGKKIYDKHEDFLDPNTGRVADGADVKSEKMLGNDPRAHPIQTQSKKVAKTAIRTGLSTMLRFGLSALR
jgi:hypothetical protein